MQQCRASACVDGFFPVFSAFFRLGEQPAAAVQHKLNSAKTIELPLASHVAWKEQSTIAAIRVALLVAPGFFAAAPAQWRRALNPMKPEGEPRLLASQTRRRLRPKTWAIDHAAIPKFDVPDGPASDCVPVSTSAPDLGTVWRRLANPIGNP